MKKVLVMLTLLVLTITTVSAKQRYVIMDFLHSADISSPYLKQDATKYNQSCGPTSTAFIYNYYIYKNSNGKYVAFKNKNKAKWAIRKLYKHIGQTLNSTMGTFDPLVQIGAGKYDFQKVEQRSMQNSLNTNLTYLVNDMKNKIPAIISLKGYNNGEGRNKHRYHSLNPIGKFNHIVIVFGYEKQNSNSFSNSDKIFYYDPYFGKNHYMTLGELKRVANQDNMDYLRFGK
ncbi:MAG: C39 family peptidase [Candidatus Gracilibacteria bacterium]|nr:C39 family peptidase [Candidatus Gracilibacteria bacterium]